MVIWITGLSGAGKTTLCDALIGLVKPWYPQVVKIDGDAVRDLFGNDLGFEEEDRKVQIQRIQKLTKFLADQEAVVLVAALYSHPDLLSWNRENFSEYFEVYINASLALVERRDPKGIYRSAAMGSEKNVVGIDIDWHAPRFPDLVLEASDSLTPSEMAFQIIKTIPKFSMISL